MGKGFNLARLAQQFGVGWMQRQAQVKEEQRQEKFKTQERWINYFSNVLKDPRFNVTHYGDQVHNLQQMAIKGDVKGVEKALAAGLSAHLPLPPPSQQQDGKLATNSPTNTAKEIQKPGLMLSSSELAGNRAKAEAEAQAQVRFQDFTKRHNFGVEQGQAAGLSGQNSQLLQLGVNPEMLQRSAAGRLTQESLGNYDPNNSIATTLQGI